jgi:hypothetical protein
MERYHGDSLSPWFRHERLGKILTHAEVGAVLRLRRKYVYMFRFEVKGNKNMHFYPTEIMQRLRKSKYRPKRNHFALMLRALVALAKWYRSYTVLNA